MSRTDKDIPFRLGGQRRRYWITGKHHALFTRQGRRAARARVKAALRRGREPEPRYPIEREYYD